MIPSIDTSTKRVVGKKLLLLGVGGMGMAPLAGWLSRSGYEIIGHDSCFNEPVRQFLLKQGVQLRDFVFIEDLDTISAVVYSSAINRAHPLLREAERRGLSCLRRGEMLAQIASGKKLIAIVGSHGKTTTTGMLIHAWNMNPVKINYILGGFLHPP